MQSPNNRGFTLIELLITLSIIAILLTLSYPNYQQYLVKSRRLEAQSALMDLANRLEHYYIEHHTYKSATLAESAETDVLSNIFTSSEWYTLSIISQEENSFTIQATPQKAQTNDFICQSFTLDNFGEKEITSGPLGDPTGKAENCWQF